MTRLPRLPMGWLRRWLAALSRWLVAAGLGFALQQARSAEATVNPLRVPDGFAIERVSTADIRFPMFATLDDRRRLYVTESSGQDLYAELVNSVRGCRISLLEDRDGDGRYQTRVTFADGLVPSMGLAWREGRLYVADPPDLITLEDTDGDGRADKRTVILSGFGHTDNGSLHGLVFGPDGWLYLTMGEPDGYRFKLADGTVLEGRSGALLRCRPDGSGIEVVSRGFENLVEVVFLPSGEIIGTDNWFQHPADGFRDALVHLLEGGLYPYASDAGTPKPVTGEPLPALALYPAVALSGLERYRGPGFPAAMRGSLFSAQHNSRKVVRHQLSRFGSTFRSTDEDFVSTDDPDFHPSDVLEDADGSLLIVDTGSWYVHHCPTGRIRRSPAEGGIHRVRWLAKPDAGETNAVSRDGTDLLAAELRALGRRQEKSAAPRLVTLLQHGAPHVRLAAAEALARCGSKADVPALLARLAEPSDRFLEHALVYGLYRLADVGQLVAALDHPSPHVQKAALLLLDHPPHDALNPGAVVARVFAADESLRRAAQASLRRHPAWVEQALPVMERLMTTESPGSDELESLRGFVVAFAQQPAVAAPVAKVVGAETGFADPVRVALLEAMAGLSRDKLPEPWRPAIRQALRSPSRVVRAQALRCVNAIRLDGVDDALQVLARDNARSGPERVQALRALARERRTLDEDAFKLLVAELAATNEAARRLAAVEVIGAARLAPAQFTRFVNAVARDPMVSPASVCDAVPAGILGDGDADAVLDYLRTALNSGWQLAPAQFEAIRKSLPAGRAETVRELQELAARTSQRQVEQLAALEPLLSGGDAARGRMLFETKAGCSTCHSVAGRGGFVGPDLTAVGAIRAGRDLIESLVMPSATLAQGYETFTATLPGGDTVTGIRVRQPDDSLVLRDASGAETRIPGEPGVKVELQKLSLMPEGLMGALSEGETRDLMAYLQSLR